jgi:hypothetical protein
VKRWRRAETTEATSRVREWTDRKEAHTVVTAVHSPHKKLELGEIVR